MQDQVLNRFMTRTSMSLLLAIAFLLLAACSDNTASLGSGSGPDPAGVIAASVALGADKTSILTDNVSTAILTATAVDSSNAVMADVAVSFSTSSGNLSASTAVTDANGQAIVVLKSGVGDLSNRTATVTATIGGQSASVPILIKGSTLALTLSPSNIIKIGSGTITATAITADASGKGKANETIRFSIGAISSGAGTLSATTLTTNVSGVASPLVFTPTAAGTVVLTAEWLNAAGAVTVTATQNITVEVVSGIAFAIAIPTTEPTALSIGVTQFLGVTVPTSIAGTPVANVRISSTSGTWTGTNPAAGPATSILQTPSLNAVSANYTAPNNSGTVYVQLDALDNTGAVLSSLSRTFVISATAASAAQIFLSASVSTISPSSGSSISTSTLTATVRDGSYNTVGNAAVIFGLLGTTGSGETVSSAVVYTNSQGKATTTFSAGNSPTLGTIYAQASIVGQSCSFAVNPPVAETNPLCDTTPLLVSEDAVSIAISFGTAIEDTAKSTQYKLPGSVQVVNSAGGPAVGVPVSLSVFPARYRNGEIYAVQITRGSSFVYVCGGPFDPSGNPTSFTGNEDINRNGILDDGILAPAEDTPAVMTASQTAALAIPNNGVISPAQASGGAIVLETEVTDSTGTALFNLYYLKSSAWFIEDEVTARVSVSGTESSAKINYELPMSKSDADDEVCIIGRNATY